MITPLDILSIESWILLTSLIFLGRYYLHLKWQHLAKLHIQHEPPSILNFGTLLPALSEKKAFLYDNECKKKYGPIYGTYIWTTPTIHIHDPDILRQIFIKEFHSFPNRQNRLTKINGKEMNNALTAVEGDQWRRIRSTMTPTFSTAKLRQMTGITEWCADNAVDALNRKVENGDGTFNARVIFSRLSLDMICSTAFSTKVDSQDDSVKEPEVAKQAKDIFLRTFRSPLVLACLISGTVEKISEKLGFSLFGGSAMQYFKHLTNSVIRRRHEDPHAQGRVDLMQLMLDAEITEEEAKKGSEKGMTKIEIIGNSILMILAGYENTANTMGFLAYNLAHYPDIQTEVQKEVDEMVKKHGKFDYDTVNSLKLLDMCINETLRLYTPVLRNIRLCEKEVTINGLTIPQGMLVISPTYGLSHDTDYWDEPYEFKPERMRDMSQIDPMMFQPFGAGPRNCIGLRFAIMEIKMSLAKILHQFTIVPSKDTPKPPLKLAFALTVRSQVDYSLRVVPRKKED